MTAGPPSLIAGPPAASPWLMATLAAGLLAAATVVDPAGRFLLVPAAVLLGALAARDLLLGPTLVANAVTLTVVDGFRKITACWPDVERLRVVTDRRAPLLELDLGSRLVVLSRRRLGGPPSLILSQLETLRDTPPEST